MEPLYFYLVGYIFLLFSLTFWISRKNNNEGFLIAGRDRQALQISASKFATAIGVPWFITYTGYAYLFGFSVLAIVPGFLISYLLFAYWAVPRIYQFSAEKSFYTQGDFVRSKTKCLFDKQLIDFAGIFINLIWLLIAIIGGAKVISFLGILSYELALLLTSGVVLGYTLLSGYKAVVITDLVQAAVILGLFGGIIFFLIQTNSITEILAQDTGKIDAGTAVGLFIYGLFSLFAFPSRYQLTFSAKNKTAAQSGMALAVIPIIVMIFMLLIAGLYVYGISPNLDPDMVFIKLFFEYLPEAFVSIGALLFLVGLMSTADTEVYNIASYIAFFKNKDGNKVQQIRYLIIGLIVSITIIAYFVRDIIGATILGAGITLIPSVAMIYIIAGGKSSRKFLALMIGGAVGLAVGIGLFGLSPTIAVFPIVFALLGLGVECAFAKLLQRN